MAAPVSKHKQSAAYFAKSIQGGTEKGTMKTKDYRRRTLLSISLAALILAISIYVAYKYASHIEKCDDLISELSENEGVEGRGVFHKIWSWLLSWSEMKKPDPSPPADVSLCHATSAEIVMSIISVHFVEDVASTLTTSALKLKDLLCEGYSFLTATIILNVLLTFAVCLIFYVCCKILVSFFTKRRSIKFKTRMEDEINDLTIIPWPQENKILTSLSYRDEAITGSLGGSGEKNGHRDKRGFVLPGILPWLSGVVMAAIALSIPWEFVRLYQAALARRAAQVIQGTPPECSPQSITFLMSVKSLLRSQFSWTHGSDPCYDYHYALLVDPVWEVSPLMVLSSLLTRCVLHPAELVSSSLGRSLRSFFTEIPAQWQPVIMLLTVSGLLILLLILSRYRLSIPMLLRIEPRSPVQRPTNSERDRYSTSQHGSSTPRLRSWIHSDRNVQLSTFLKGQDDEEDSSKTVFTSTKDKVLRPETRYSSSYGDVLSARDNLLRDSPWHQNGDSESKPYIKSTTLGGHRENGIQSKRLAATGRKKMCKENKEPRQKTHTNLESREELRTLSKMPKKTMKKRAGKWSDCDWTPARSDLHVCSDSE